MALYLVCTLFCFFRLFSYIGISMCIVLASNNFTFVCLLGVAFSKHIIQTYNFIPNGDMRQMLEVSILCRLQFLLIFISSCIKCF